MLKGLNGNKINEISNAIIELLQGQGGALSDLLSSTGSFSQTLADRYQVISDVIHNLNTVLTTVDQKSAQFNASVDQLQQLVTGLAQGRDPIAGAIPPLASAAIRSDRACCRSRGGRSRVSSRTFGRWRPNWTTARTRSTRSSSRWPRITCGSTPSARTGRSSTSTTARCVSSSTARRSGRSAGRDIRPTATSLFPQGGPPDPSKGRCSDNG